MRKIKINKKMVVYADSIECRSELANGAHIEMNNLSADNVKQKIKHR